MTAHEAQELSVQAIIDTFEKSIENQTKFGQTSTYCIKIPLRFRERVLTHFRENGFEVRDGSTTDYYFLTW